MKEQIRVLLSQGLSIRKVALALGVSRQTVRKFGRQALVEDEVKARPVPEASAEWDAAIDWDSVSKEVAAGTTIKQLHQETYLACGEGHFVLVYGPDYFVDLEPLDVPDESGFVRLRGAVRIASHETPGVEYVILRFRHRGYQPQQ